MLHLLLTLSLLILGLGANAMRIHPTSDTQWCIHAEAVVPRSGTQLGVERCTGSFRQEWNYWGNTYIQLTGTDLCMAPASKKNGSLVYLRPCPRKGAAWKEVGAAPGTKQLAYAGSNFCLDNKDGRLGIHNAVQVWECHGRSNQQWGFEGENGN